MTAPLVVARSDLLMTGPSMLIRYFAELVPLQVLRAADRAAHLSGGGLLARALRRGPGAPWLRDLVEEDRASFGLAGAAAQAHLVTR